MKGGHINKNDLLHWAHNIFIISLKILLFGKNLYTNSKTGPLLSVTTHHNYKHLRTEIIILRFHRAMKNINLVYVREAQRASHLH